MDTNGPGCPSSTSHSGTNFSPHSCKARCGELSACVSRKAKELSKLSCLLLDPRDVKVGVGGGTRDLEGCSRRGADDDDVAAAVARDVSNHAPLLDAVRSVFLHL